MYRNNNRIAILLSTYNGEKYLADLIESIVRQSCQDYTLYIRDDGSTDNTISIIEEYTTKYKNILFIDGGNNLGPKYTFLRLLDMVDSDYVMFCDQDDIWMPNKVYDTFNKIKEIEEINKDKAILVYTDLRIVDDSLSVLAESSWEYHGFNVDLPTSFNYLVHYGYVTGCTMMLNRKACEIGRGYTAFPLLDEMYHDWFLSLLVAKNNGLIIPLKEQTIIYRRHQGSETDALELRTSIIHRLNEIGDFFKLQRRRYQYFKNWGYGSYMKFLYYKTKLFIIKLWQKHD